MYYVMPFVAGETLRDRLDRETKLGIDELTPEQYALPYEDYAYSS